MARRQRATSAAQAAPTSTPAAAPAAAKPVTRRVTVTLDETFVVTLFTRGDHAEAKVEVDLRNLTADSVLAHMRHGIRQRLNDAASTTPGSRAQKVERAKAVASAIAANQTRTRASGLSPTLKLACEIFVAKFHGGKAPKGGATVVAHLLSKHPKRDAIMKAATAAMALDI